MNTRLIAPSLLLVLAALGAACGGGHKSGTPTPTPNPTPGPPVVFTVPSFPVPAQSAVNECFFVTTSSGGPGAVQFSFTPGTSLATHLWVFTSPNGEPNGQAACDSPDLAWTFRFTSGEGAGPFHFPAGVASPVGSSETWVFRMHYVNPTLTDATDSTRVEVDFDAPGSSFSPAGIFLTGKLAFNIGGMSSAMESATCTLPASTAAHIFAFAPEMNQYATHVSVVATVGGNMSTPVDEAWDLTNEAPIVLGSSAELAVAAGDQLATTCSYDNTSSSTVSGGTGFGNEECFDFVYYEPAISGSQYCVTP